MKLNNKWYNFLKWLCIIAIPSLTTLASVVLKVWNIVPDETITAIVTTSSAVATCIGALIGISSINYKGDK